MRAKISTLKNTVLLLAAFTFLIIGTLLIELLPLSESLSDVSFVILLCCCAYMAVYIIWDYKTWLVISAEGVEVRRRGKRTVALWGEIKRLEYSGVKWCKLFDVLLIHVHDEVIYVEYTFDKYEEIWSVIQQHLTQGKYPATIDADIPQR